MRAFFYTSMLSAALFIGSAVADARGPNALTPAEREVCASLRQCVDILKRHDPTEFDYQVLQGEFQRFGPAGRAGLLQVATSAEGNAGIARIVLSQGPLTPAERALIARKWSPETAAALLPFTGDKTVFARDLLLRASGWRMRGIYGPVRARLAALPVPVQRAPMSADVQAGLLSGAAHAEDAAVLAPYLRRVTVAPHRAKLGALMHAEDPDIIDATYAALYRDAPGKAFPVLLEAMKAASPAQARALGDVVARRHRGRADGFYARFALEISEDAAMAVPARAAGLHAALRIAARDKQAGLPASTPARLAALDFLLSDTTPDITLYAAALSRAKPAQMPLAERVWAAAVSRNLSGRDRVAQVLSAGPLASRIKSQLPRMPQGKSCNVAPVDLSTKTGQMPFFEELPVNTSGPAAFVARDRLRVAYPSRNGWMAAYRGTPNRVFHYDNASGQAVAIPGLAGDVVAILPDRPLKLGETTDRFWVQAVGPGESVLHVVTLDKGRWTVRNAAILPKGAKVAALGQAASGDLLLRFAGAVPTLRYGLNGVVAPACRTGAAPSGGANP